LKGSAIIPVVAGMGASLYLPQARFEFSGRYCPGALIFYNDRFNMNFDQKKELPNG
jgi:hypothetical protein